MKFIREPKLYLVGSQMPNSGLDDFLRDNEAEDWESDALSVGEYLSEVAGRLCYMSYGKPRPGGNKAYNENIIGSNHGSVLEHAVWSFIVTGGSRSFSHEFVRHRAGMSPSQLSQRYVDESVAEYVEPDIIANDEELHAIWSDAVMNSHAAYVRLVDKLLGKPGSIEDKTTRRKTARQAARSVLPNATETKIFFTINARAIRHFLELRGSRHAEVEIRKVANQMLDIMEKEAPNLFSDYTRCELSDGTFELTTPNKKV